MLHAYITFSPHPPDKMVIISQTTFLNAFLEWKCWNFDWIFSEIVPKGPIDNESALVQLMACRLFGANPLPEPILSQLTDAYMRH